MRYRDRAVIPMLARSILVITEAHRNGSAEMKGYYQQILDLMCRKLENFVELRVSIEAHRRAQELGLSDLRKIHWAEQTGKKMNDAGRKIFHWEHVMTVSDMRNELLTLAEPTQESVEMIVSKADVAWILKNENDRLNERYRSRRTLPLACYEDCGIRFMEFDR